ncbi:MAG: hypothetical protein WKF34_11000 [Pyrinomonadaceae bacterium]
MKWDVESVPELAGYSVEWAEPGNYYLSRRNILYHAIQPAPPFKEIGRVSAPGWKRLASRLRLSRRLLRFSFYNVIPLANDDIFVTFDKSVGLMRNGTYIELSGLARPCRVLRSGCAVDADGSIYFGEYLANDERGEMRVYRYRPGLERLEIAHTFPERSIKHIHGIYVDEHSQSMLCMTGDADSECQILRTYDGFATTEVVGGGDETWRAVSVLFTADAFYYGTDAEYRDNEIFRVDRRTFERKCLGQVSGTVFYSKQIGPDLFFGTTAENAPSQKENVAAIWHVDKEHNLTRVAEFTKDRWPAGLFQFGTVQFPASDPTEDCLYFNVVATAGERGTYRLVKK